MEDAYKEVYFNQYCGTCKHWDVNPKEDPCDDCLGHPVNLYSHKPVHWTESETK